MAKTLREFVEDRHATCHAAIERQDPALPHQIEQMRKVDQPLLGAVAALDEKTSRVPPARFASNGQWPKTLARLSLGTTRRMTHRSRFGAALVFGGGHPSVVPGMVHHLAARSEPRIGRPALAVEPATRTLRKLEPIALDSLEVGECVIGEATNEVSDEGPPWIADRILVGLEKEPSGSQ